MRIGIIGGGPAGIAASIAAKQESLDAKVFIIEKQSRIGGKIPFTGNGKCNISNIDINLQNYYFDQNFKDIVKKILDEFDVSAMNTFLLKAGILTTTDEGRIYPASGKASQVRDALECLVYELGIQVVTECECYDILKTSDNIFEIAYKDKNNKKHKLEVDKVILASGTPASLKRVSDNNSLYLAGKCNLSYRDFFPGLMGYICDDNYDKSLSGVRANASISYKEVCEYGEIQFTDDGISGIPTFQLSLSIGELIKKEKIIATINFLFDFSDEYINKWLSEIEKKNNTSIYQLLSGLVNPKIALSVLNKCKISSDTVASRLSKHQLDGLILSLKRYEVTLMKTKMLSAAQVALGGIGFNNFDSKMQSEKYNGLFSCGEVLDIAGRCGGFNLHFAFASGVYAGKNAVSL